MTRHRVAVLGAGIIGLLSALEIQDRGHEVVLIDPHPPGDPHAASYGNGAWLSPGTVMPMSVPGLWRKVPGFLLDPDSPFVIRWRHLPGLMPWLVRFLLAGSSWAKVERCAEQRVKLCRTTVQGHLKWAAPADAAHLIRETGLIFVYRDRAEFTAEAREWALRRRFGIPFSELDSDTLHALEPALAGEYRFGARIDEGAYIHDTREYCRALAALVVKRGGRLVEDRAVGFDIHGGRLRQVRTAGGAVPCDRAVIAAGAWSAPLAKAAGDKVPLISERGYHIVLPGVTGLPNAGLMPSDGKMAVVQTADGLRVAGQVELASLDAAPNWKRADILLGFARRMFPAAIGEKPELRYWLGHRPSTPDGLPSVGRASGCADIFHAFGHGHSGLCQGPATAGLVADFIDDAKPAFDPAPFAPQRFR